jgi:hypothetical protein
LNLAGVDSVVVTACSWRGKMVGRRRRILE